VHKLKELKKINSILIATNNPGKFKEIKDLLPKKIKCFKPKDFDLKEPKETAKTFKGNARIKSLYCLKKTGLISISDDSGLEVESLNKQPGIYSARWAGKKKDFSFAMEKVRKLLLKKKLLKSKANFMCCISIGFPSGKTFEFEGKVFGQVSFPAKGTKGFGYDAIFTARGEEKTFGQLQPKYKNQISHRYMAFKKIKKYFNFN
jgi:XTP/dITP diphosphohydrolase